MKRYRFTRSWVEYNEFYITAESEEEAQRLAEDYEDNGELDQADLDKGCSAEEGDWSDSVAPDVIFQGEAID